MKGAGACCAGLNPLVLLYLLSKPMNEHHFITPPPDLVYKWAEDRASLNDLTPLLEYIATRAAQWGADQELDACVKLLELSDKNTRDFLYSARRPKPPSLKQQALETLKYPKDLWSEAEVDTIRRALEQLDD